METGNRKEPSLKQLFSKLGELCLRLVCMSIFFIVDRLCVNRQLCKLA